jgi:cyclophilin family peptidyl-prolyl cis-trans isomerase
MLRRHLAGCTLLALPSLARAQAPAPAAAAGDKVIFELKDGPVTIQLLPDVAPLHVQRIKNLVQRGFYDGTPFHRVIEGFMAQGGDPTGKGTGGSDLPNLKAEFTNKYRFIRGICGMARSSDPNSANSQFFIMFGPAPSLDGQYTIWGRVIAGMDAVDKIKRGNPNNNGIVTPPPDKLIRATLG